MGGGGVWRTAAMVAFSGLIGVPVAPPAEKSIRKASRLLSEFLSSQGAKSADAAPLLAAESWDLDEWDLDRHDALVVKAGEPTPRLVFGEVPSFQEAKAATLELKNAIVGGYLSSNSSVCEGSAGSEVSVQSPLLPGTETKSCMIEPISTPSMPKDALLAFEFLSTSPMVQKIVASLASNPDVCEAIMQDPLVKDILQSHQTAARIESEESPEILEESHHSDQKDNRRNGFIASATEIMLNFKVTVTEKVRNVSKYFINKFFGSSEAENTSSGATEITRANFMFGSKYFKNTSSGANGNTRANFMFGSKYFNNFFGSSEPENFTDPSAMIGLVVRLVVLVILVVLFKRV